MYHSNIHSDYSWARFRVMLSILLAAAACAVPVRAQSSQDPIYVFHTNLGDMRVQLYPDVTPKTVANFLSYVNSGAYNSSIIHRSVSGFVIQGGGYTVDSNAKVSDVPANAPVTSEAHLSNTRGTIAMALSTGPNSGTDEWFFNEGDNSAKLDGTTDGGPFTVFGKIADSASLAVMDQIAAVQTYNAGGAFSDLPLVNYNGGAIVESNFVRITSVTPAWNTVSTSVGADDYSRLLWDNAVGGAAFWLLSPSGVYVSQQQFGPFSGWTAKEISTGGDLKTRALWTNTSGQAAFWRLDPNNNYIDQQQYGPFSGWTATSISTGPDGYTRVLWDNTSGQAAVWLLDPANKYVSQVQYGPFSGWTAKSVSTGGDLKTRVLWTNTSGQAAFWRLDPNNNYLDQQQYGPFSGWTATALTEGADGYARAIWDNVSGTSAFWLLDPDNTYVSQEQFGPYSGFTAVGLSAAPDASSRALWIGLGGQIALWDIDPNNKYISQQQFGPF